jgi:hypothetical protein
MDSGLYVLRDGWTRDANTMLLDCGAPGALTGGHAHADTLAFDLTACGRPLIVDPGTYVYASDLALRNAFRAASAHNTLTLDGKSSSEPDGPFSWKRIARPHVRRWESSARFDFFEGEHDGYASLVPSAVHLRGVLFLKGDYWIVRDIAKTTGSHCCELHFHFASDACPYLEVTGGTQAVREAKADRSGLDLFVFAPGGRWRREEGWVSRCYGSRAPASVFVFSRTARGPQEFVTFLLPRSAGAEPALVQEIMAQGGRAFEVRKGAARDLLLLAESTQIQVEGITSDGRWTWARFSEDGAIQEVVVLNASRIEICGQVTLDTAPVGRLYAQREGKGWTVKTDAQEKECHVWH